MGCFWCGAVLGTIFIALGCVEMAVQQRKPYWKCWGAGQFVVILGYGFITDRMLEIDAGKHMGLFWAFSLLHGVAFVAILAFHSGRENRQKNN